MFVSLGLWRFSVVVGVVGVAGCGGGGGVAIEKSPGSRQGGCVALLARSSWHLMRALSNELALGEVSRSARLRNLPEAR